MRQLRCAVFALCLAASAAGQQKVVESIEVSIVNIDVAVTDAQGKPVTGLTKDDFEITEDGARKTITNFSEIRSDRPAADNGAVARPRRFILFIDNGTILPAVRKDLFVAMRSFVDRQLAAGDQASVINWSNGFSIVVPFTADKGALTKGLNAVEAAPLADANRTGFTRAQQQCTQLIDAVRGQRMNVALAWQACQQDVRGEVAATEMDTRLLLNALNVAMSTMSGVEAKKVLIFAGGYLPLRPGAELYQWATQAFVAAYRGGFDWPHDDSGKEIQQVDFLERLAHSANAYDTTLEFVDVAIPNESLTHIELASGADSASDFLRLGNTEEGFRLLAERTGGTAVRIGNFNKAFDAVSSGFASYYSLGFKPSADPTKEHAVVVRPKNRAYAVRWRQTYRLKTTDDEMTDRAIANVFTPAGPSDWPVTLRTGQPQRTGDTFAVPIEVTMPSTLTLLPDGEKLAGGFTVYVAVGNRNGVLSTTSRSMQPVSIPRAEEAGFRKAPIAFTATLTVRPGENLISVAVLDQTSHGMGFGRATVVTP